MRAQWSLILGLIFALIVAIFAVFNVESVSVNYLFGTSNIPLILVIFGSALLGGLVVGMFGILRQYTLQRKVRKLEKELELVRSKGGVEEATSNVVARLDDGNSEASDDGVLK
ncbi:LapA family protein [Ferdinandcohnia quinoae]|uniref:Lipopolysaccharide assembly protein LapA domain-containing protein n=1 Tax=Fredinandcohnia quinoae TaxID=2918902 RepID=A0AAW5E739_9BACI|nr:lipopolysaccharide assembly protein LapA domain-containing protein [Fredinandcohnia sp. SECRCQ15]MCH1625717.1 lipopolysaccharide assembly protein LapA domain-containing protein [Fredinandcohnia sp. SECRCQ15]